MDKTEIYILLFTDSFFANLAINFSKELVFYAIKAFNTLNKEIAVTIATFASIVADSANYLLGRMVFNIFDRKATEQQQKIKQKREQWLMQYRNIFLLFSIVPVFGKFIIVAAGFTRFPVVSTLIFCTILQLIYYTYLMFL